MFCRTVIEYSSLQRNPIYNLSLLLIDHICIDLGSADILMGHHLHQNIDVSTFSNL